MSAFRMTARGEKALIRKFNRLADRVKRRVAAKAIRAAGTPVAKAIRTNIPATVEPEAINAALGMNDAAPLRGVVLRKAMGRRSKSYRAGFVKWHGVGIRVAREIEINHQNGDAFKGTVYAAQIAKAVEFGTSQSPADPFVRRGFEQSKGQAIAEFSRKARKEIIKEAKRA